MVEFRKHPGTGKPYPITKGTGVHVPNMPEFKDALADYYENKAFMANQPPQIARILKEIDEDTNLSIDEKRSLASTILARAYYYGIHRFSHHTGNPELDIENALRGQAMLIGLQNNPIINGIDRQWVIARLEHDGLIVRAPGHGPEGMHV